MFIDDEEKISDIYSTPIDRRTNQSKDTSSNVEIKDTGSIVLDMADIQNNKKSPSVRDSKVEVPLSPEDLELKKKKRKLVLFIILMLINVALFSYLLYLLITIFMTL